MSDFPYPGLRPFRRDESDIFFGRDGDITRLTKRLANYHFIAVVGNSGSGKSSLIQAGLLARLNLGVIRGQHWRTAKMRPGNYPFRSLSIALLRDTKKAEELALREEYLHHHQPRIKPEGAVSVLENELSGDPNTSYQILEKILPDNHNLLIIVDQFEELFRYHASVRDEKVKDFIQWLLTSKGSSRIYIVITLRLEFEDECSRYAGLKQAIENGRFHISYLTNGQLEESIKFPAQVCHGEVEPQVVERLLADLEEIDETYYADRLPLLQYTLSRMWLKVSGAEQKVLKLQHYEEIGGNLAAALDNHIQQVYMALSDSDKKITEILFRRLSQLNKKNHHQEKDTYIRHPIKLKEVASLANVLWQAVSTLVDYFRKEGNNFLFSPDKLPTSYFQAEDVIDITHESIIRQWKQLKKWADEEAQWADFYREWEKPAKLWEKGNGELWYGRDLKRNLNQLEKVQRLYPTLEQLKVWSNRYGENFELAWQFLEASKQQQKQKEEQQRKQAEQARQQELKQQNQLKRQKKKIVVVISILIFATLFVTLVFWEYQNALFAKKVESLFELYRREAALLARFDNYTKAREILKETYQLDSKISDSPRHARNLLASFIDLMSDQGQKYSFITKQRGIVAFALSPDKQKLALVRTEGKNRKISSSKVELFEAKTDGKLLQSFNVDHKKRSEVKTVVFHPQGEWLATGGDDGQIIFWSLDGKKLDSKKPAKERESKERESIEVWTLAINPAGNLLASGGTDNIITVWNLATNQQKTLGKHQGTITDLAFSPNGEFLASASEDKTARLWQVSDGKELYPLPTHTQQVVFSPDGKILATGSDDKTIRLWKVDTGQNIALLSGHQNKISGIAFIADGRYLASASADSTLRLWDVASGVTLRILQGDTKEHITDITTDGQSVFSSSWRGIKRWDTTLPYQYVDLPKPPTAIAIAPNVQQIAIGFKDGSVQGYSLPLNNKPIWQQEKIHTDDIKQLAVSADGRFLASTSSDEIAKVWQIQTDKLNQLGIIEHKFGRVNAIAFSPDNKILLSAGDDGQIGLFKLDLQEEPQFYPLYKEKSINSVMWDASGDYVLTASDYTASLWQTRDLLATTSPNPIDNLKIWKNSVALSPDAKRVAVVKNSYRGSYFGIKIYPDRSQTPYPLWGHRDTVIRALFSPDSQQLATVSGDNTVRFWDLLQQSELFTITLPTKGKDVVWDFDFRCFQDRCWVAVPLSQDKKLLLYELSYGPTKSVTN